jgi:hypothetical protein
MHVLVTPRARHYAPFSIATKLSIITILRCPQTTTCILENTCNAKGIVLTLQQVTTKSTKEYIRSIDSNGPSLIKGYITNIQVTTKLEYHPSKIRVQMGLRGLNIHDGIHNPP